jgi:hypothetical protein
LPKNKVNGLGSEGGKAIAEALKINSSIQHLNLQSNENPSFFSFFVIFIIFFPQTPKKTKSISKKKDNEIGPEGVVLIAEALKINSSIQHLNLESNDFF